MKVLEIFIEIFITTFSFLFTQSFKASFRCYCFKCWKTRSNNI